MVGPVRILRYCGDLVLREALQPGGGIGRQLKQAIIEEVRRLKHHTLIARVAEGSVESQHLNEKAGCVLVDTMKEVGCKFGRLLDVHMYQKML
jgi:phosphinothricin acetyltransferase